MEKHKLNLQFAPTIINRFQIKSNILIIAVIFFSNIVVGQQSQISKWANTILLNDTSIRTGHFGISVYEPATDKYWFNFNEKKYFIPASNTKLFTLYAGMKYLGDSLVGIRYYEVDSNEIIILPTGDPTFLHPDFKKQPVYSFLKEKKKIIISASVSQFAPYGNGWAWNDYQDSYMAMRSKLPMYGNLINIQWIMKDSITISPSFFKNKNNYFENGFEVINSFEKNDFQFVAGKNKISFIPFTNDYNAIRNLLMDTLKTEVSMPLDGPLNTGVYIIHSQPTDSLFKPMMHNSDNFFAEQALLMASNEFLGYMSDEKIIDTILKTDLKDIPQKPKWVDGSGLSRYNLCTPKSLVYLLNKMKNNFGMERMKTILPTGGEGTLSAYYIKDAGFIFAKTGTLSNNCALSGFLYTQKGKLLIFSALANNYITGATPVRKAIQQFLQQIRDNY